MMKFKINQAKGMFFPKDLEGAVDAASKKVLKKVGQDIRQDAKKSIRPAKQVPVSSLTEKQQKSHKRRVKLFNEGKIKVKPTRPLAPSKPGEAPRSRTGLLRKFLFFVYDPQTKSVVIGPALLNKSSGAQSTLEYGGSATNTSLRFVTRHGKVTTETKTRVVPVDTRPYMRPAYEKNEDNVRELFRNSITT